ncbi:MAG: alpha-1,2-fucosyltransferase [Clostridiales bacterium]|nr:alpha-1,2-fucosyltransferase [Clostridiales bacterium]
MVIIKTCGGLGNQLFQYAAALEIAETCHDAVKFDLEFQKKDKRKFELRKLGIKEKILSDKEKKRKKYIIQNLLLLVYKQYVAYSIWDNQAVRYIFARFGVFFCTTYNPDIPRILFQCKHILLAGSFSNEKFFSNVIGQMRNIMKTYIEKNKLEIETPSVCVHIRRGDYVGNRPYEVCTENYYYQAMRMIEDKVGKIGFLIFSDDIDYVRHQMRFEQTVTFCEEKSTCKSLGYMVQCSHYVISNSSFSWWAQKLNASDQKLVYAPRRWYNSDNNCDLYDNSWIKIEV